MVSGQGGIRVVWRVMVGTGEDMGVVGREGGAEEVVGKVLGGGKEVGGVLVGKGMIRGVDGGRRLIICDGVEAAWVGGWIWGYCTVGEDGKLGALQSGMVYENEIDKRQTHIERWHMASGTSSEGKCILRSRNARPLDCICKL